MNFPLWAGEAFEVCSTQGLSSVELSVDLQTLFPPTTIKGIGVIRTGRSGNLSLLALLLPLLPALQRPVGCAAGTPPAGDLLHLLERRRWGGILQSSISNITHNLEVKDTGDRLGSAHRRRDSLLASRQANLAPTDGWGEKRPLHLFVWCVCRTWCLCASCVSGRD